MTLNPSGATPSSGTPQPPQEPVPKFFREYSLKEEIIRKELLHMYEKMDLPPSSEKPRKYLILNQVHGGSGDIAAAAMAIKLILKMDPKGIVHWSTEAEKDKAKALLPKEFQDKVEIHQYFEGGSKATGFKKDEADIVIYCPLWGLNPRDTSYLQKKFNLGEKAKILFFQEAGSPDNISFIEHPAPPEEYLDALVRSMQKGAMESLPLGLEASTGLFMEEVESDEKLQDRVTIQANQLEKLKNLNPNLEKQILAGQPNFTEFCENYSLAFGYAHGTYAKECLIDFYTAQETKKNVAVVLYQVTKRNKFHPYTHTTVEYFKERLLTPERIKQLREQNYGKVIIKSADDQDFEFSIPDATSKRELLIVLRERFSREEMTIFQKVANAQLATGDNSAAEVFAYAHKNCLDFYMYEDISNRRDVTEDFEFSGAKGEFLDQQIRVANQINPKLGELLQITSKSIKITKELRDRALELLKDPEVSLGFGEFVTKIRRDHNFNLILRGMIKRHLWQKYTQQSSEMDRKLLLQIPRIQALSGVIPKPKVEAQDLQPIKPQIVIETPIEHKFTKIDVAKPPPKKNKSFYDRLASLLERLQAVLSRIFYFFSTKTQAQRERR